MKLIPFAAAIALIAPTAAWAHVMLSPSAAPPGATLEVQVVVGHGCSGKPTTALKLNLPQGIGMVHVMDTPGWRFSTTQRGGRTTSVTWTANNPAAAPDKAAFSLHVEMPRKKGVLAFPATQTCGLDKVEWADAVVAGKPEPAHPAPAINVGGAALAAVPMASMAGMTHAEPPAVRAPARKATPGAPALSVSRGWTRPAAKGQTAAGYLVIANTGRAADTLLSASSPQGGRISLHQSVMRGDMSTMAPVSRLTIAPGQTVTFGPNGYHLMIQGLKADLKLGATLPVVLTFARAGKVRVTLKVATAQP